ncbi:MAG TPA: hypothetical protein VKB96_01075, partial [Gammaproteobacteria bacterium]|nr:hypothetical protein [Gammaproteobacteria bacterium]
SYNYFFVPVLFAGLALFFFCPLRHGMHAMQNSCYILAGALWATVLMRVTMLVIVEATWIPSIFSGHSPYLTSLYFLIVSASLLSIAAWVQLRRRMPFGARPA